MTVFLNFGYFSYFSNKVRYLGVRYLDLPLYLSSLIPAYNYNLRSHLVKKEKCSKNGSIVGQNRELSKFTSTFDFFLPKL